MRKKRRGRDRMVVGFTITYAISASHHWSCEFESRSWRGELDTTLYDKVCQWLAAGRMFSPVTSVCSSNKTDSHDITEILLKIGLNTITMEYVILHHIDKKLRISNIIIYFAINKVLVIRFFSWDVDAGARSRVRSGVRACVSQHH